MSLAGTGIGITVAGRSLVDGVDLSVGAGEVVAVIGANGAGKSTLLKALGGARLSHGIVSLDGISIDAYPRRQLARQLAVLPQHSALDFPFSVDEVIALGRIPADTSRAVDQAIVNELIALLELGAFRDRVYTSLSGGERQRTQLARVFCQLWDVRERVYWLLDEPTAPLDVAHQLRLMQVLKQLTAGGAGVLVVLHDLNLAARFADRVAVMKSGKLLSVGTPAEVITEAMLREVFDVVGHVGTSTGVPVVSLSEALPR